MELDFSNTPNTADLVKESNTADFATDVIEASLSAPIIVDFWAPWCGPCKTLGPIIERAVMAANGAVKLIKIDIDQNPEIAQQMRVQSIPAVYAFYKGQPVDGFVGALPESQIKSFLDRILQITGNQDGQENPLEAAHHQAAEMLEQDQPAIAADIFQQLINHDPEDIKALTGYLSALLKLNQISEAQTFFDQLSDEMKTKKEFNSIRASLELASQAGEAQQELTSLLAKVSANENDHQARYDLAVAQSALGESEAAIDNLLFIFQHNRTWNDGAAHQQLLKIFEALGFNDECAQAGRRKMSSMLFS